MKIDPVNKRLGFWKKFHHLDEVLLILIIFFLHLFFMLARITPRLSEINPHDGVKYIESGRLLFRWGLRDLSWAPLVAFVYAPAHLLVGHLRDWFLIEAWLGNVVLFSLMWFSFYYLAISLQKYISKIVMIGLLISTTIFYPIIENQSDALFVALSALALAFLIRFYENGLIKYLWVASLFVGLGVLTRVETIILVVPLLAFALLLNQKRKKTHKVILAALIPVVGVLCLFFAVNLITHGHLNSGLSGKSIDSFVTNQAFLPGSKNQQAYQRGEAIFGPLDEEQGSVMQAILYNPGAVAERAAANLLRIPDMFLQFFGKTHAPIFTLFGVLGLYTLAVKNEKLIIILLLIWPLHALVSLIFLPRHIVPQMAYVFFILAAIGITRLFSSQAAKGERLGFLIVALGLVIYASFILGASLVNLLSISEKRIMVNLKIIPLAVFLISLFMLGFGFSFPNLAVGETKEEWTVYELQNAFPEHSSILSPYHTVAIAAKMNSVRLPGNIRSQDDFLTYIHEREIKGVLIDENIPYSSDVVLEVIQDFPNDFQLVSELEGGTIRIYVVNHLD